MDLVIYFIIFILLLFIIFKKLQRHLYIKNWIRKNESYVCTSIEDYLIWEWYNKHDAIALSMIILKLINKKYVKNERASF